VEISVGSVGKKTNKEKVSGDVGEGSNVGALVAFSGNGIEDLLDGKLRDNKGLTIGVDSGFNRTFVLVELIVGTKATEIGLRTALSESVCDGLRHSRVRVSREKDGKLWKKKKKRREEEEEEKRKEGTI
jgi:hypothetical protein